MYRENFVLKGKIALFLWMSSLLTLTACSERGSSSAPLKPESKSTAASSAVDTDNPASFVIRNVRLFDGMDVYQDRTVVVVDGHIEAIEDSGDAFSNLRQIDGQGNTLLPGLMDAHAHTQTLMQLQETLRFGVTTIFDMATSRANAALLSDAARNRHDVAGFFSAILVATIADGHGTQYGREVPTLSSAGEAAAFVQARANEGSDYLKIILAGERAKQGWPTLDAETVMALTKAARSHDLLSVVHIETIGDVRTALEAGADVLAHVWRDTGAEPDISAILAEKDVFVATTLVTQDGFIDAAGGSTLVADPMLRPYLTDQVVDKLLTRHGGPVFTDIDRFIDAATGLVEAGVTLLAGTDVSAGTTFHGVSMHRELELLVRAGLSPQEALAAATSNVARAFGITDRGVIAPGKRADLLLVRGDPTVDILATRDIVSIWRGGIEFHRELREGQ